MNFKKMHISPLTLVLIVTVIGIYAVLHGYMNPPRIQIEKFDAGSINNFLIGDVKYFQEEEFYLVGMKNGNIRALQQSMHKSCSLTYFGNRENNDNKIKPFAIQNIFFDDCNNMWDVNGNSFSQNQVPLKTLFVKIENSSGDSKVIVELSK